MKVGVTQSDLTFLGDPQSREDCAAFQDAFPYLRYVGLHSYDETFHLLVLRFGLVRLKLPLGRRSLGERATPLSHLGERRAPLGLSSKIHSDYTQVASGAATATGGYRTPRLRRYPRQRQPLGRHRAHGDRHGRRRERRSGQILHSPTDKQLDGTLCPRVPFDSSSALPGYYGALNGRPALHTFHALSP